MTKLNRPKYTSVDHKHNIAIVVDHSNDPCVYPDLIITYTLDQTHVNPSPRRCVRRITAAMDAKKIEIASTLQDRQASKEEE